MTQEDAAASLSGEFRAGRRLSPDLELTALTAPGDGPCLGVKQNGPWRKDDFFQNNV